MDRSNTSFLGRGFTLVELLIVVAIIGILAMIVLLSLRGGTQIQKARDSRRKADMSKIQRCLEEYNNDHGYYVPANVFSCGATSLSPCMPTIPCDPWKNTVYPYQTDGTATPRWYRLFTMLEYTSDPAIANVGCSSGCVAGGTTNNYYVSSPNAPSSGLSGFTCDGQTAPICGQPQNYVGMCASCCPGSQYRVTQFEGSYYCCLDASCQ
ncbi:type II secretion system protein [Candidatus Gottesmanbacteria bacterium]|nr:type II secretion system protein [Candidatus Gottesmanbacteria bacterium]